MTIKHSKDEMVSFRLSSRMLERIRKVARRDGQQVSELFRLAILRYVERREREQGMVNNNGA